MNEIKNSLKIAFILLGLFVGAGFTSGQEPLQFYVKGGSLFSVLFGSVILTLNCYFVLKKISDNKDINTFDDYVVACSSKVIGRIFNVITIFLAFLCFFGMLSAAGSTFQESFGLNFWYGVFAIAAACFIVFIAEAKGILAVNSIISPIKIFGIVFLCIIAIKNSDLTLLNNAEFRNNTLMPTSPALFFSSLMSALSFVSFNCAESGAVFVPLRNILSSKSAKLGAILGGIFVAIILSSMWFVLRLNFHDVEGLQLPMLFLINKMNPLLKGLYLFLIISGTFTTAVSMGFAILNQIKFKNNSMRIISALLICAIGAVFSKINFSIIVGTFFKAFGYVALIWMAIIIYDFFKGKNKKTANT